MYMRTISIGLLAAQKAGAPPYIRIKIWHGATEYIFTTQDSPNRILSIPVHRETPIIAGDPISQGVGINAIIRISDYDNTYVALDLRGYKIQVGYGYLVGGSPEYSYTPEMKILNQRSFSNDAGMLGIEFACIDKFAELEIQRIVAGYIQ